MAEPGHGLVDVDAGVHDHGAEGVPQIVAADPDGVAGCHAQGVDVGRPGAGESGLGHESAFSAGGDEGGLRARFFCFLDKFRELFPDGSQDRDLAAAGFGFGIHNNGRVAIETDGLCDGDQAGVQVDVGGGQGQDLTAAEARVQHQAGSQGETVIGSVDQLQLLTDEGTVGA